SPASTTISTRSPFNVNTFLKVRYPPRRPINHAKAPCAGERTGPRWDGLLAELEHRGVQRQRAVLQVNLDLPARPGRPVLEVGVVDVLVRGRVVAERR